MGWIFIVLTAIFIPYAHHLQLRYSLEHFLAQLKARGEPLGISQLIPLNAPPEKNAAPIISTSLTNLPRSLILTHTPTVIFPIAAGRGIVFWQQDDIRTPDGTNTWKDLGRALSASQKQLDDLQSLTNHPFLDFNLDYKQGLFLPLPHLWSLHQSAEILNANVLYNLHQHSIEDASGNLRLMIAIVNAQAEEPILTSQRDRLITLNMAVATTWEILQYSNVPANDLLVLQTKWQALKLLGPFQRGQLMDRAMVVQTLESARKDPKQIQVFLASGDGGMDLWRENQWRLFWSYADERRALQINQVLIEAMRLAETNRSYQATLLFTTSNLLSLGLKDFQQEVDSGPLMDLADLDMHWIFSEGARDSFHQITRFFNAETARNIVVAAIALKRFELAHGHPPDKLEELTPEFLKTFPTDWMDGKPIRYRRNSDNTFLLYSVGQNGKDDGGNASVPQQSSSHDDGYGHYWQDPAAFDYVWPQPATSAEIQKYYSDQSRKHH
jgi:hypothetical protein